MRRTVNARYGAVKKTRLLLACGVGNTRGKRQVGSGCPVQYPVDIVEIVRVVHMIRFSETEAA